MNRCFAAALLAASLMTTAALAEPAAQTKAPPGALPGPDPVVSLSNEWRATMVVGIGHVQERIGALMDAYERAQVDVAAKAKEIDALKGQIEGWRHYAKPLYETPQPQ